MGMTSNNVSVEEFTGNLTTTLTHQLKRLYNLGARKFALMAINPNGCSPMATARSPTREHCVQVLNRAVHLFNVRLETLVVSVRTQMPGSVLVFVNSYKVIRDIIRDPASKGFSNARSSCCEVATINEGGSGILCKRGGSICTNRSAHVFFDGLHPTEAVNLVIATKAYASNFKAEVYPMNLKQLSEI
ncbi:GDSL esterase/lipase [Forsythia ovata]|uniref:GDSL esterase/lipase n=1 Tax=Forsythia ovata TaxID=205694 RepID=A0ABD1VR28_9LAMI